MTLEQTLYLSQLKPLYSGGKLSSAAIADSFGVSRRTAQRLLVGVSPTRHPSWNRLPDEVVTCIIQTRAHHPEYNCQWIAELVSDQLERPVSRSSVYRICAKERLLPVKAPKRTSRHRFEAEAPGDLVQMDTTWGYWWGSTKLCLILLLDDHSRYILHAKFVEHDTASENMSMIRETVEKYGLPRVLYTDNASFFKSIRHGTSRHQAHAREEYETDIGRSCREAGITHLTHKPYQPQGKGKIERLFRFIQERFVSTLADDMTLEEINSYFAWWVKKYNDSHVNRTTGKTPKERFTPAGFTPLPAATNLDDVFCWKYTRKVDTCNQFSFEGVSYTIPGEQCLVAFKVTLHVQPGKSMRVWHGTDFICTLPHTQKQ